MVLPHFTESNQKKKKIKLKKKEKLLYQQYASSEGQSNSSLIRSDDKP
jgi:hypothetical protein